MDSCEPEHTLSPSMIPQYGSCASKRTVSACLSLDEHQTHDAAELILPGFVVRREEEVSRAVGICCACCASQQQDVRAVKTRRQELSNAQT